jgi:hypothetical protein
MNNMDSICKTGGLAARPYKIFCISNVVFFLEAVFQAAFRQWKHQIKIFSLLESCEQSHKMQALPGRDLDQSLEFSSEVAGAFIVVVSSQFLQGKVAIAILD